MDKFGHVLWAAEVRPRRTISVRTLFFPMNDVQTFHFSQRSERRKKALLFSGSKVTEREDQVTKMKDVSVVSLAALM